MEGLSPGEYLYGFGKDSKLFPVTTFILYNGIEDWKGPTCLHDMLDFADIPDSLKKWIPNYRINIIEIRKIKDTSVFQTDLRHVLDFLRYAEDKNKLKELVENNPYYQSMEEDAYDVVAHYAGVAGLVEAKEYYIEEGKMNMCTAIKEMIEDGRAEGRLEGKLEGSAEGIIKTARKYGASDTEIIAQLMEELAIDVKKAKEYLQKVN